MNKVIRKYVLNLFLIVFCAVIALYFSLKGEFKIVLTTVKNANYYWISLGILAVLLYNFLEGYILSVFAKLYKKTYSLKQGIVNAFCATFFNGITPFQSGGQLAQVFVFNKQGIKPKYSASILLMNFIVYQVIVVLYSGLIILTKYQYYRTEFSDFFSLALIGFAVNFSVIVGLFLGAKSKTFQNFVVKVVLKIGYKLRIVKDYDTTVNKVEQQLTDFRRELDLLQKNKKILIVVSTLTIIRLTILYLIPFLCFKSLNLNITNIYPTDFIGISAFIYMITSFVPIPGASGGSEGVFVIMFGFLLGGVGAKSSMILWRFITYYFAVLFGAIVFALNKDINKKEL